MKRFVAMPSGKPCTRDGRSGDRLGVRHGVINSLSRLLLVLLLAGNGCRDNGSSPMPEAAQAPEHSDRRESENPESSRSAVDSDGVPRAEPRAPQDTDWFEDVTAKSGIVFTCRNGRESGRFLIIESFGGGAAVLDADSDGLADVFLTGGGGVSESEPVTIRGLPPGLFRNRGEFSFRDVSAEAGLRSPPGYTQGCAVSDFNNDGFPDVLVCCYGNCVLYCNQGDGTFTLSPPSALITGGWGTAAAFGDIDGDGNPDLVLARYTDWSPATDVTCISHDPRTGERNVRDLCGPTSYPGTTGGCWKNLGDGSFEEVTERVGLTAVAHGLGVLATDLTGDGTIDIYVTSDALKNLLYINDGLGQLVESAESCGVAYGEWGQVEAGMGIAAGDYNEDQIIDLFVTNFENEDNALYTGIQNSQWMHRTAAVGLAGVSRMRVGFATSLTDFNGDGWQDLFVLNGNPIYSTAVTPFAQCSQLFSNEGGRRFRDVTEDAAPWFAQAFSGRGAAAGDLDNDGAPDLIVSLMNQPVCVLRGRKPPTGYVSVRLAATRGERDATGSVVQAEYKSRTLTRWVMHGDSFYSQSDARILLPVAPQHHTVDVTVTWPGRGRELFSAVTSEGTQTLVEGHGRAVADIE